jgi:hypothetical protein
MDFHGKPLSFDTVSILLRHRGLVKGGVMGYNEKNETGGVAA